jgi:hypothetical protein
MHKPLAPLPVFEEAALVAKADGWKSALKSAKPGHGKIVVEWTIMHGPSCLVFPMGLRHLAVDLTDDGQSRKNDERWADFLEFTFVPQVTAALEKAGLPYMVICTDQRPIQVMRERRRAIAKAAEAKTGVAAHH